ncbi:hypothetical protein L3X38_007020 [Prunus dulcis]|uniref:Uncharacterized protein n=1 Tax=Prunus dulcis TaxID=3755 RepID=A0AAD5F5S6_PRUDU|nr:hypothetical protein L3X38_007020 [Prunus dulcis]
MNAAQEAAETANQAAADASATAIAAATAAAQASSFAHGQAAAIAERHIPMADDEAEMYDGIRAGFRQLEQSEGSAQAKIYDCDGLTLGEFVKGDIYIRDLKNTKGHISGLTCGEWHPRTKDNHFDIVRGWITAYLGCNQAKTCEAWKNSGHHLCLGL